MVLQFADFLAQRREHIIDARQARRQVSAWLVQEVGNLRRSSPMSRQWLAIPHRTEESVVPVADFVLAWEALGNRCAM